MPIVASKPDPLERYVPLGAKVAVYLLLLVYLLQAAEAFYEYTPGRSWPFLLTAIRNGIFLFIHEGGHALFAFFGRTLNILGGSFWQIVFPLLSFIIAIRNRSHFIAPFALFWVGTNMMDVSLYMRDAPIRILPLLGGHKSWHDWWNLFREWDMLDSAGAWADVFYFGGLLVSIGSIGWGVFWAVRRFLEPAGTTPGLSKRGLTGGDPALRKPQYIQPKGSEEKPSSPPGTNDPGNTFDGLI